MTIEIRPFEQSLPMALLRAREAAMRQFRPALKAHDLTDQQWRVLRALTTADQPMTVGELATATFLLGPSLTRILGNLGSRGLVDRVVPEHDQRQGVMSLTEQGAALVARVAPHSEATYDAIEDAFGSERMVQLMALLEDMAELQAPARNIDEQPDPSGTDEPAGTAGGRKTTRKNGARA